MCDFIINKILDNNGIIDKKIELMDYYMMNDNYFDEFILQAITNKRYLYKEQLEMQNQKDIEFEIKDPF